MFGKHKTAVEPELTPVTEEKPTPMYLRAVYPYKVVGDPIEDLATIDGSSDVYETWCDVCQTSIRSQGMNIQAIYEHLMAGTGCLGCGSRDLVVKRVDMSKAPAPSAGTREDSCK